MSINYLLALGLDFDPAPSDESIIDAALKEKKTEWSSKSMGQLNASYYRSLLDNADKIEKSLKKVDYRNEKAEEARKCVYGLLDDTLKKVASEDSIGMSKIVKVSKKVIKHVREKTGAKDWEITQEQIVEYAKKKGYKINEDGNEADDKEAAVKAYELCFKAKKGTTFKGLDNALETLGFRDLYSLVNKDNPEAARHDTNESLLTAIQAFYDEKAIRYNQEESDAGVANTKAKSIFSSAESRAEYDAYLSYLKVSKILDSLKEDADLNDGEVSEDMLNSAIASVTTVAADKSQAPLIVRGYCYKKKLTMEKKAAKAAYCRCGYANPSGSTRCSGCGSLLKVSCPKCGKSVLNTMKYCDCGAPIGEAMDEAEAFCRSAEIAIDAFDFEQARLNLNKAAAKWKTLPQIDKIQTKLDEREKEAGSLVAKYKDAMSEHNYESANTAYKNIQKLYPNFVAAEDQSVIEAALSEAKKSLANANAAASEADKIKYYSDALTASADCQEAITFMRSHKPEPVTEFKAVADNNTTAVRLRWDASVSAGLVEYVVRRQEGTPPSSILDGVEIAKTGALQVVDDTVKPGKSYYYSVFSERFGAVSGPTSTPKPVLVTSEVTGLKLIPGDEQVEIHWSPIEEGSVEISLESPEARQLKVTSGSYFVHPDLQNGVTYKYRVRMQYSFQGKTLQTEGVVVEATPIAAADAICDLRAKKGKKESTFILTWTENQDSSVKIFSAENRDSIPEEESLVSLDEIENNFTAVSVSDKSVGSASMSYSGNVPIYIFSVVECGRTGIVGNSCRVFGKEEIKILNVFQANNSIAIKIEPPEKAVGFVTLCRSDRFASGIAETNREGDLKRQHHTMRSFEENGLLNIKDMGNRDYYISVFAEYGSPMNPTYSDPTEYLFSKNKKDKITYSIRVSRSLFTGSTVTLTFKSQSQKFTLPATVVVVNREFLPIFTSDGMSVMTIPEQEVSGQYSCEVTGIPKQKNLYLKAIPQDDKCEAYALEPGSNAKIS